MVMAVQHTFSDAQVTISPWIDDGFYYDFYFPPTDENETGKKLTDADLNVIKN